MKVIDVLNRVANDELKDGFKFKYKDDKHVIAYTNDLSVDLTRRFFDEDNQKWFDAYFIDLNDEIEIIGVQLLSKKELLEG